MLFLELSPLEKLGEVVECPGFFIFRNSAEQPSRISGGLIVTMDNFDLLLAFHVKLIMSLGVSNVACSFPQVDSVF